jgi:hypothetical protein
MNARSIRRAAERKIQKLASKEQSPLSDTPRPNEELPTNSHTASPSGAASASQLAANRSNALLSTGPCTERGKRISSLNAVKTGLTGQTVLLPSDDAAFYERHMQRFIADHKPETDRESELVQNMADAQWRMNRIPGLEMALFARGRVQFADLYEAYEDSTAATLTDAETMLVYHRELRNLATQEARIRRQYQRDLAELKQLQEQHAPIAKSADRAPSPLLLSLPNFDPNGFEFSDARRQSLTTRIAELEAQEKLLQAAA